MGAMLGLLGFVCHDDGGGRPYILGRGVGEKEGGEGSSSTEDVANVQIKGRKDVDNGQGSCSSPDARKGRRWANASEHLS
jgi:hypothetical protein